MAGGGGGGGGLRTLSSCTAEGHILLDEYYYFFIKPHQCKRLVQFIVHNAGHFSAVKELENTHDEVE